MRTVQRQRKSILLAMTLTWLSAGIGWTASVAFDIQPRALRVGEAATCTFTVRGIANPPTPGLPPIQGFQAAFAGTQQSYSFVNGQQDNSVTFTYQLVPLQVGKFSVGPFTYATPDQSFPLPAIAVEVVPAEGSPAQGNSQPNPSELLYAVLSTDQTNIYNQQVFDIVLSIYSQGLNIGNNISLMNMPASGLSLQPFQELQSGRQVIDNKAYDVRRFRAKAQALTAGAFKLEPTLQIPLLVQRERRSPQGFDVSFFDDFFGTVRTQPVNITPKPLGINVKPLPPEGQPPGYAGAVGQFSFEVQVKPTDLNAGDPVTLTSQITGEGNLENISAPQFVAGDDFKVYEPRLISKDVDSSRGVGRKTFEQVLIPRSERVKMLPALMFSYFDPVKGTYDTIARGPYPLVIHPSSNTTARMLQAVPAQPEASTIILGTDIVYLKPAPTRWTRIGDRPWYLHRVFLASQLIPLLAVGLIFALVMRREQLAGDVALARRQQAPRSARVGLRKAEKALSSGDRKAFYEALWETLASYFGNRLNLSPGELAAETVLYALNRAKANAADIDRVRTLFERCERERFGVISLDAVHEAQNYGILKELNQVLRTCERIRL
jgi:hypothetical protein